MRLRRNPSQATLDELRRDPAKHIPVGVYCHGRLTQRVGNSLRGELCPFWDVDEDVAEQENGYCHYLQSGDWDSRGPSTVLYAKEETGLKAGDVIPDCANGLLWDQCKECGVNDPSEGDEP